MRHSIGACVGRIAAIAAIATATSWADPGPALRGRVVDAATGEPVTFVTVQLLDTGLYKLTNAEGTFTFDELIPGTYTVRLLHVAYETAIHTNVQVVTGANLDLSFRLVSKPFLLEEVVVTPGAFTFMDANTAAHQTMSREDILSVPQIAEDVFRAVNRLPGLSSGDYAAHFSIRGGRHDETLILLDGLELYEPYHLKDFNEGAISIIDAEMTQGVELMTGGFPAVYGNKRSGVFKITSRAPDRAQYSLGLSFVNARATAMAPFADGQGSWLLSGRSGYLDLVLDIINQNDLPSPRYHDLFAKVHRRLSSKHSLLFDVLHAGDRYTFDAASTTGFQDTLDTRERATNTYGNSYAWATLHSELGRRVTVRTMASASLVTRSRDGVEEYVDRTDPLYAITNDRNFSILGLKQDWTVRAADDLALTTGVDLRRLHTKDTFTNEVGRDPNDPADDPDGFYPVRTESTFEENGTSVAAYVSGRWRPLDPLVVEVGGRYDRASYTDDRDVSPRVSAALRVGERSTVRAGWGHFRQIQGIDDVVALNEHNRYYPAELSKQWTAGLEHRFPNGAVLRIEGYAKDGSDLRPVYRNWKGGIDTFPETNEDRILVFPHSSLARGVEIYLDRRVNDRLALRASYALSESEETVERIENVNGSEPLSYDLTHPTPQDQRHAVNVDATYRVASAWTINTSLSAHSGWPATLEELASVTGDDGEPDLAIRPAAVYGDRLPLYLRLDARATRKWSTRRGDWRLFIELVNVTNHANIFGYDYFRSFTPSGDITIKRDEESWFTILPSVGISWSGTF